MATQTLEELLVAINASTDKLRSELSAGDRSVKKFGRNVDKELLNVDKGFARVTSSVKGFAAVLGAGLGFDALVRRAGSAIRSLEEVGRQADSLGTSVESIQELTLTFREFDLESNDVADALGTIADRALDAQAGTKSFIDDFKLLGVSVDDLRGKRPDELFELIAERVAQIEDPTRRTAGIVRIFGDDLGRRLNPLLLQGSEGLQSYAERWRDLGAVVDEAGVRSAGAAAEKFRELGISLSGKFTAAVAANAEEIAELADVMISAAKAAGDFVLAINRLVNPDVEEQIGEVRRQIEILKLELDSPGLVGPARDVAEARLKAEREKLVALVKQLSDLNSDQLTAGSSPLPSESQAAAAGASAGDAWLQEFLRATNQVDFQGPDLPGLSSDRLTPELTADQIFPAREILDGAFEQVAEDASDTAAEIDAEFNKVSRAMGDHLEGAFRNAFDGIDNAFGELLAKIVADFVESKILGLLTSFLPSIGGLGFLGGLIPGFASGGRFGAGGPIMVGERGPELVVPDVSGRVMTAAQTERMMSGAGGGVIVNIHNAPGPAKTTERNVGGVRMVDIVFEPIFKDLAENGPLSRAIGGRFGLNPSFSSR